MEGQEDLTVYVDTDWAGCHKTRKSTSGGAIVRGSNLLTHWSTTQQTIALSSGEAELKGILKGAAEGLGLQSVGMDLNTELSVHLYSDASAAIGMVNRKGLGRVRHVEVGELRIQDIVKQKRMTISKVAGEENPADILTKHVDRGKIREHCNRLRMSQEVGRAEAAPATSN